MTIKEREAPAASSPESFGFGRISYRKDHDTAVATVSAIPSAVMMVRLLRNRRLRKL